MTACSSHRRVNPGAVNELESTVEYVDDGVITTK